MARRGRTLTIEVGEAAASAQGLTLAEWIRHALAAACAGPLAPYPHPALRLCVESAELPHAAFDFWPLLAQWLGQNWLWLSLLGGAALALVFRDWLLKQPAGRFWPVGAALLPPLIPFARNWDQQAPAPLKGCIVPILLLAVAVLQLYGQERSERYRKAADDAVEQQGIELRRLADEGEQQGIVLRRLADTVEQQGIELRRLADAISDLASEAEEETDEVG